MIKLMVDRDPYGIQRRVTGWHHWRMDGLTDLKMRAAGRSVLDLGCNRGRASIEMADHGATLIHGCDNDGKSIEFCREHFADYRSVQTQFEVVDLTEGAASLDVFGAHTYEITLLLATYHKLKRAMPDYRLSGLIKEIGRRTTKYFGWRGTKDQHDFNSAEIASIDQDLAEFEMVRIHTSYIATELGVAAIWAAKS